METKTEAKISRGTIQEKHQKTTDRKIGSDSGRYSDEHL